MSGVCENLMIPNCIAASPERTGSQDPEIMCHSTGTDLAPNVTEQRAVPVTGIGSLLYGLSFTCEGIIRPSRFHRFARCVPQTDTLAPVSAMGELRQLFTMTDARKSFEQLDFSLGRTLFFDVLMWNIFMLYADCCGSSVWPIVPGH